MTEEQVREVVRTTVAECLTQLGIDKRKPFEMQRDFQWLRKAREGSEKVRSRILYILVGAAVTGILGLLAAGAQSLF